MNPLFYRYIRLRKLSLNSLNRYFTSCANGQFSMAMLNFQMVCFAHQYGMMDGGSLDCFKPRIYRKALYLLGRTWFPVDSPFNPMIQNSFEIQ